MNLRVVLTVPDFDKAVAFYRDVLGLEQLADWSGGDGRVILLDVGHATLELFDERQAESVDRIEAGRRVSGPVRLALRSKTPTAMPNAWSLPARRPRLPRWFRPGAAAMCGCARRTGCS